MSLKKKLAKRRIGYARVSTQQQDLARQVKALKGAGCTNRFSVALATNASRPA